MHTTTGALIHYSLLPLLGQRKASSQPWKFTLLQASSCQPKSKKPEGETGKNVCRKTPTAEHAGAVAPRGIVWVSMGLELVFHINLSGHLILHSKDTQKQTWKRDNLCLGLELPRLTGHPFVYLRTLDHVITVVVEGLDGNVYSFQARNGIRNWLVRTITEVLPREPQTKGPFTFVINPNNARGQLLFPGSHTAYQSLSLQPPHTTQWTYGDAPLLFPRRTGITKVINATQPNQQNCFGGQSLAGEIQAVVVNKDNKTTRWNPGKKSRSKLGNRLLGAIWTKGPQCHVFYQNSKRQVWTLRWSKEGWRHTNLSRTLGLPKEPLSLSVYQAPSPATL